MPDLTFILSRNLAALFDPLVLPKRRGIEANREFFIET